MQFEHYYKHNNTCLLVNTRSHSLEHLLTRKMAGFYRTGCLTVSDWLQQFTSMYEYWSTCLLILGPFCTFFPFCWMCNILIAVLICAFLRTNRIVCPFICALVFQLSSFVKYMKLSAQCLLHAPSPTLWPPPILSHFLYPININSHWQTQTQSRTLESWNRGEEACLSPHSINVPVTCYLSCVLDSTLIPLNSQ